MSEPYIGEIRYFTYNFIPEGWLACDGQLYSVGQYQALFAIIGNLYGGDARTTFATPDLRGQAAMGLDAQQVHCHQATRLGQAAGAETVTLAYHNMPPHTHGMTRVAPVGGYGSQTAAPSATSNLGGLATSSTGGVAIMQTSGSPNTTLADGTIGDTGGGQGHENRQPYLTLVPAIAWGGIFPVPD